MPQLSNDCYKEVAARLDAIEKRLGEIEKGITMAGGAWFAIRWGAALGAALWGLVTWIKQHIVL